MGDALFTDTCQARRALWLGLFGGTFNPIHRGHYHATVEVLRRFDLDRVDLIPSALPPHKNETNLATSADRCEMVRLALQGHPRLQVSTVELARPGPSYTIDTLHHYQSVVAPGSRLFFILGTDAFFEIDSWKAYRKIFRLAELIVVARTAGRGAEAGLEQTLAIFAQNKISPEYHWSADGRTLDHPLYYPIHPVRITPLAISSSRIRHMLREGRDVSAWVAPAVLEYITRKGLYR